MGLEILTLGSSKTYTRESLLGGGAVVGKNVTISSITPIEGGNRVTFSYTLDNGTVKTSSMNVMDGIDGLPGKDGKDGLNGKDGQQGVDGIGISKIEKIGTVDLVDTYRITFTDNSTFDYEVKNGKDGQGGTGGSGEENKIDSISVNGVNVVPDENKNVDITVPSIEGLTKDTDLAVVAKTGSYNDLNDIPDSLPASDVYQWAKQSQKPTYTADEVGALPDTTQIPSIDDVDKNTKARHEHSNKTVLDSIDNQYIEKWNSAYSHSISSHAPENAQENVIEDIKINGTSAFISDKTVNITTPTKTSDITNDSGFITNITNDLVNYYLKSEVYTKEEVQSLIGRVSSLELVKVDVLPTEDIKTNAIYLLPKDQSEENNIYTEYIYMDSKWETIGDTSVDLSQYALKTEIPTKLSQMQNDANYSQFSGSYNDLNDKPTIVGDVQTNGISIVTDGVANINIADSKSFGVVKVDNVQGVGISSTGILTLTTANSNSINSRSLGTAITPLNIDYAVKAAMCDGKGKAWTDSEKTGAWSRLSSIKTSMDEVAIAGAQYYLGEQSAVSVVLPDNALVGQVITVVWYNGATAATLSITGTRLDFDYTPGANSRSEINALWDGLNWAVLGNEMAVIADA